MGLRRLISRVRKRRGFIENVLINVFCSLFVCLFGWMINGSNTLTILYYLDSLIPGSTLASLTLDHYGPAELLFAAFHRSLPPSAPRPIGCTKWCPQPQKMSRAVVERAVRERCERMQVESLDLLQFHCAFNSMD